MAGNVLGDTLVTGELSFGDSATVSGFPASALTNASIASTAAIARTKLAQDTDQEFIIPFTELRVHDALTSLLPSSAGTDDLGLLSGTFGTDAPTVTAGDLKAAGSTTRYARFLFGMPAEYDDNETVKIRCKAGMETTVADTSCVLDVEAYLWSEDGTLNGSPTDLYTGATQSMNSLTSANLDYQLTSTSLVSGSIIDVRIAVICNDGATGTAVTPSIYNVSVLCDIRG